MADVETFEKVVQEVLATMPKRFSSRIENLHIIIEDVPSETTLRRAGVRRGGLLLGLYEGVPLSRRGVDYGMAPVLPDRITLFKANIETISGSDEELRANIRDTLIHELGHYYGMTEKQIRDAGY
ncbi:MAG TPA: metallopeptidase family protein [Bacteroidota bacterium]|nr:metallopeptidase family protein [Bacteroidota bacterium]